MDPPTLVFPTHAVIRIEVPRGGFVKRAPDGGIDFVSPLPCPYNYGSVVGTTSMDGEPLDALVLGPRLGRGTEVSAPVRGVVGFVDAGIADPKLVCAHQPLRESDRRAIEWFFWVFAFCKRRMHRIRREPGATAHTGWLVEPS